MQLYALDLNQHLTHILQAHKSTNYFCLECAGIVRVRSGTHRQPHFYHLSPTISCRQHAKGMIHLHLQKLLFDQLPKGECSLEYRFPAINRIADVIWHPMKLIFEIQCSGITGEEVLRRNQDYKKEGYQVIWILHDDRYNQWRLSSAELSLQPFPRYFTNMNVNGEGIIYDQFEIVYKGIRHKRLDPLAINPSSPAFKLRPSDKKLPKFLIDRFKHWPLYFAGDLMSVAQESSEAAERLLSEALELERKYISEEIYKNQNGLKAFFGKITQPYKALFRYFLEKACRS